MTWREAAAVAADNNNEMRVVHAYMTEMEAVNRLAKRA